MKHAFRSCVVCPAQPPLFKAPLVNVYTLYSVLQARAIVKLLANWQCNVIFFEALLFAGKNSENKPVTCLPKEHDTLVTFARFHIRLVSKRLSGELKRICLHQFILFPCEQKKTNYHYRKIVCYNGHVRFRLVHLWVRRFLITI